MYEKFRIGTFYVNKKERLPGIKDPSKKTRWRFRPKEEWQRITVPAIIDRDLFDAAQALASRNEQYNRRNSKHEYLLGGARLRCGRCGTVMTGVYRAKDNYRHYRCTQHGRRYQFDTPCGRSISANRIEEKVWVAIVKALQKPSIFTGVTTGRTKKASAMQAALDRDREGFQRQLAQCAKRLKRWDDAFEAEIIDQEDFRLKRTEIMAHRENVTLELARLEEEQRNIDQFAQETVTLTEFCKGVREGIQTFDTAQKQRTLNALDVSVTFEEDGTIQIKGHIPMEIPCNSTTYI